MAIFASETGAGCIGFMVFIVLIAIIVFVVVVSCDQADRSSPKLPKFGRDNCGCDNGLIYPLFAHVLAFLTRLTIPRRFNLRSSETDCYIFICLSATLVAAVASEKLADKSCFLWVIVGVVFWRLFELFSVTLFEFCVGSYRGQNNKDLRRVVNLKLVNLVEMIVLFGICYYLPQRYEEKWVTNVEHNGFAGVFDAIYFSTVTAATLGYGDYAPTHWLTKALAMVEVLFFVLIGLSILSILRSLAPLAAVEQKEDRDRCRYPCSVSAPPPEEVR